MAYTTIDNPELYFQVKAWTGTGNEIAITFDGSENMQPDWVWLKRRDASAIHVAHDSVRGATKRLIPNSTDAETTQAQYVKSFDSNGITFGTDTDVNNSGSPAILWGWKAGGSASSNSDGSITSTVSANTTSGFSIVSYTGNGTDGATVGHGLTSPKLVLIKDRDNSTPWLMYGYPNHPAFPNDGSLIKLNESDAMVTDDSTTELSIGSSTVTFVDAGSAINANSTQFIMYCFQEKKGYSKFGSYTGNGNADGTFVYTGFKPAFIMLKPTSTTGNWFILDNKRSSFNVMDKYIRANQSSAEATFSMMDFVSNGVKIITSDSSINGSGVSYIFMAFAESPFVTGASAIPTTAR